MAVEAPTAPAPAAPAAPSKPALPNAPKVEISASKIAAPAEPAPPPKAGSAREKILEDLRSKVKPDSFQPRGEPSKKAAEPEKKPDPAPETEEKTPEGTEIEPETGEKTPQPGEKPGEKKEKANPWKLVEEYKQRLARVETEKLETEKRAIPEAKWKEKEAEIEQKTKRLQELEEEIRYVSYRKTPEYQAMQKEYEGAWERAVTSLSEITVEDEKGNQRPMNADDILELVNATDVKAQKMAIEKYDELANLVMQHRDKIRGIFDKKTAEEDKARTEGATREKQSIEHRTQMTTEIKGIYSKANEDIKADPKYGKFFMPIEGDENVNQRLAKGFELADRAFSENPLNAKTPEERASIVRRHAAVRNRCAAFGRLVYENGVKDTRIAELEKMVAEYKGSEPEMRGSGTPPPAPAKTSGMDGMLSELRKRAKQL